MTVVIMPIKGERKMELSEKERWIQGAYVLVVDECMNVYMYIGYMSIYMSVHVCVCIYM